MQFLNPLLLFGLAAVSVPIIIHLINRRKFRKVIWAAMRFVQLSIDQNQRRMQLEDLILLLLRCALLALLAMALARPALTSNSTSKVGEAGVTGVVVLDNSYSMGLQDGDKTRFDHAKDAAQQVLQSLPKGSAIAVYLASDVVRPLIEEPVFDTEMVKQTLAQAPLSDRATAIFPAVRQAVQSMQGRSQLRKEVYVITDNPAVGWEQSEALKTFLGENEGRVKTHFIIVGGDPSVNLAVTGLEPVEGIVPRGRRVRFNVRITNFSKQDYKNAQVRLSAGATQSARDELTIPILRPGEEKAVQLFASFTESGPQSVTARVVQGEHGDRLPADDLRTLVVNVIEEVRVLLVNGEPGEEPWQDETFFLQHSLRPVATNQLFYVKTDEVRASRLDLVNLDTYNAVALANIATLPPLFEQTLTNFIARGGGMLLFPGKNTDTKYHNDALHARLGLLPARLAPAVGDASQDEVFVTLQSSNYEHEVVRIWNDLGGALLAGERTYRRTPLHLPRIVATLDLEKTADGAAKVRGETAPFTGWAVNKDATDETAREVRYINGRAEADGAGRAGVRVGMPRVVLRYGEGLHQVAPEDSLATLAQLYQVSEAALREANPGIDWAKLNPKQRLRLPLGQPAVVESAWGLGRVYQFSSTADVDWCSLPASPQSVPLLQRMLGSMLRDQGRELNVAVGAPLNQQMSRLAAAGLLAKVEPPQSAPAQAEDGTLERVGGIAAFRYDKTDRAGVYQVRFEYQKGSAVEGQPPAPLRFAAQADTRESDLSPMTAQTRQGIAAHATVHDWPKSALADDLRRDRVGAEFWLPLVLVALVLAALEIYLAQRFSQPK
ncbi:MAG: VWA domain-containing protein [Pedosphaera sp.]|nr:VWA domain-containing protein [Pedosphaera sp.]MSU43802.1 VWA domain-containing protein [Pedosphaera sp.]